MTLREDLLGIADDIRAIPAELDERQTTVTIRRTYAFGDDPIPNPDLTLSPPPKVRQVTTAEIIGANGRFVDGDVRVGPITPHYEGGGYTREELAPTPAGNEQLTVYVLAGQISGEYTRIHIDTSRNHAWFLTLRRREITGI